MTKKTKNERKRGPLGPLQTALALRLRSLREAQFPPVTQAEIARLVAEVLKLHPEWAVSADPDLDEADNLDEMGSSVIFQKPSFHRRTANQKAQTLAENGEPLDADESE
ncbi:MAG: hypothetical protein Q8S02_11760 [Hydrogenophaga sp.]|nr:hypothetical protein [Hydrogenophaga sp.]